MKKYILVVVILAFCYKANAQILKKLKDKIKDKTEKVIDKKVDDKVSTGDNEGSQSGNSSEAVSEISDRKNGSKTAYKSKFDFIPGNKILLWDDFIQDAVGDFPDKWFTKSSGEVITLDDEAGKWLMMRQSSEYFPDLLLDLPENFTIQFDLVCTVPFSWGNGMFNFSIADIKNLDDYRKGRNGGETMESNFNFPTMKISLHPGLKNPGNVDTKGYGNYYTGNSRDKIDLKDYFMPVKPFNHVKISIWKQKQRIRVYVDENKVLDLPKILPEGMKPNLFAFESGLLYDEDHYFISNLRIAASEPDNRNKLLIDGKLVSTGILFDVNSDNIKPESYGAIKEIAGILKENSGVNVLIVGHTDNDGDDAKNLELSKKRAAAVKKALVSDFDISADRLQTDGKGATEPLVPNTSAMNKANNRRVEFMVSK
ncbi:MAG: OmpA family protein [Flavobacteriaceae bacterium]|nr:OmpA family protein [Flavobacteriaceae bacterium]